MTAENAEQMPSFEVPAAPAEHLPTPESPRPAIEQGGPSREGASRTPATAMPTMPPPPPPTTQTPAPPVQADAPAAPAAPSSAGLQAADADLIEKEWVSKAKKIVADNREDPYKQQNEMARVKADYVQKRFNKNLKLDDSTDSPS